MHFHLCDRHLIHDIISVMSTLLLRHHFYDGTTSIVTLFLSWHYFYHGNTSINILLSWHYFYHRNTSIMTIILSRQYFYHDNTSVTAILLSGQDFYIAWHFFHCHLNEPYTCSQSMPEPLPSFCPYLNISPSNLPSSGFPRQRYYDSFSEGQVSSKKSINISQKFTQRLVHLKKIRLPTSKHNLKIINFAVAIRDIKDYSCDYKYFTFYIFIWNGFTWK